MVGSCEPRQAGCHFLMCGWLIVKEGGQFAKYGGQVVKYGGQFCKGGCHGVLYLPTL
jgi:hypothetical protein